jgi:integrase
VARKTTGVVVRHARSCRGRDDGGSCSCEPSYEAWVYSAKDGRKVRRTFPTIGAAKTWRAHASSAMHRGQLRTPVRTTLSEEAASWIRRAEAGEALTRSSRPYKPAVIRGVESDFRLHIESDLGALRISEIRRRDVQALVDRLRAAGLSGSKVRGVVTSLKIVLRRALEDDELTVNPTALLRLPGPAGTRERVVAVAQAELLIRALPEGLRALYAAAAYAGLRRGELRGLRWDDVDLAGGVIRITRSWDEKVGEIAPKSDAGAREVPIAPLLRNYLDDHKARTDRAGRDFVFGSKADHPFTPTNVRRIANNAWAATNEADAKEAKKEGRDPKPLTPIGLHELRHSFVSLMHDAGFSLEEIGDYVGHASTYMTSRYRHLLPGAVASASERFGAYLERANTIVRLELIEGGGESTGAHPGAQGLEAASLSGNA